MKNTLLTKTIVTLSIAISIFVTNALINSLVFEDHNISKASFAINNPGDNDEILDDADGGNNGIPINFGGKNCVCKGVTCQDANWISFREYCGYGNGTDAYCAHIHNGQCDN